MKRLTKGRESPTPNLRTRARGQRAVNAGQNPRDLTAPPDIMAFFRRLASPGLCRKMIEVHSKTAQNLPKTRRKRARSGPSALPAHLQRHKHRFDQST